MTAGTVRAASRRAASELIARSTVVRAAIRRVDRHLSDGDIRVLCYHGVTAAPLPVKDPCFTTAERFREQMRYLSDHFDVVHLEDAFDPRFHRSRPVACITFDDGFTGIYDHAFPILSELGIPATSFLVTDLIGADTTVWFGSLHQAIIETDAPWVEHAGQRHSLADPDARSHASMSLQSELKALDAGAFAPAFAAVMAQLGVAPPVPSDDFRMLNSEQIREMAGDDLVRFGGHSATHQILTRTTPDDAAEEIVRSVSAVDALVERPSTAFAYPNGASRDYDDRCIDQLKALGIRLAVTTMPGPNRLDADPFHIRRIVVGADEGPGVFPARVHHLGRHARSLGGALTRR